MVIVFLKYFRKVRFKNMQFLKDGVWTVFFGKIGICKGISMGYDRAVSVSNFLSAFFFFFFFFFFTVY